MRYMTRGMTALSALALWTGATIVAWERHRRAEHLLALAMTPLDQLSSADLRLVAQTSAPGSWRQREARRLQGLARLDDRQPAVRVEPGAFLLGSRLGPPLRARQEITPEAAAALELVLSASYDELKDVGTPALDDIDDRSEDSPAT